MEPVVRALDEGMQGKNFPTIPSLQHVLFLAAQEWGAL
jgi:hypothetical protein